jgi:hypothetical protein
MVLAALEGPSELRYWLKFRGTEALASHGYKGGPELRPADLRALAGNLVEAACQRGTHLVSGLP